MFDRPATPDPHPYTLGRWLLVVAAMVFAIVIVGGITRLTESGLSITDWKPIRGIIPPLTTTDWQVEFAAYRTIPQYTAFNQHMTLDEFKQIYFWEYIHRLLARGIGLLLAGILVSFWWLRRIPKGYGRRLIVILALGGLQGVIGWWMVASGLADRTEVSHLRLAVHLIAAMLIFSVLIWTALDLFDVSDGIDRGAWLPVLPAVAIAALALQLVLGAFTAGLRAGYAFSSWPLMGDSLFPASGWWPSGLRDNLIYNPIVVQFVHRWWAWVVAVLVAVVAARLWKAGRLPPARVAIGLVAVQILLGILTLLTGVWLPIAVAHQAVAVLLLGSLVWSAHALGSPALPAINRTVATAAVS